MRAADARPANMRPADMRRPEPTTACPEAYSAAVPAKPAEMAAATVAAKTVAATVSTATVPTATAAAGVCFECDKRHDEGAASQPCKRRSSTPASRRCGTGRAARPWSAEPRHTSTNGEEPLILTQELSFGRPPDDV